MEYNNVFINGFNAPSFQYKKGRKIKDPNRTRSSIEILYKISAEMFFLLFIFYCQYVIHNTLYNYAFALNIFHLYTLYIEQHINAYNNIQYTNGIQKLVLRFIRICIPYI